MNKNRLQVVEYIPYRKFKEKIEITKKYYGLCRISIIEDSGVLIEKYEKEDYFEEY